MNDDSMLMYLSGPISAPTREEVLKNLEVFTEAENFIKKNTKHRVCNPRSVAACETEDCNGSDSMHPEDPSRYMHSWGCYLKYDLIEMLKCDAIVLLPNWTTSNGARLESFVAEALSFPAYSYSAGNLSMYTEGVLNV